MSTTDVFQRIDSLDAEVVQRIVDRLEFRGTDQIFVEMRDTYFQRLDLAPDARILDLGCGTGVVTRAIAARDGFCGKVVGIDYSTELIDAAETRSREQGFSDQIEFRTGDAGALEDKNESYDAVILHTVVSHVPDPPAAVSEAARVVRQGGTVTIFDGDYASLTYATGDHDVDAEVVQAILSTIVANPYVMREMPALLSDTELEIVDFISNIHAEAGAMAFFSNLVESYIPMVINAQRLSKGIAEQWLDTYRERSAKRNCFASCNFFTYIARRVK